LSASKRSAATAAAHFRSPWQQSVNVFGSWSRPDCVQELHQEAQLNLQTLLQGKKPSACVPGCVCARVCVRAVYFTLQPASKGHVSSEGETSSLSIRGTDQSPSLSPCGSDRPLVGWSSTSLGPPVAEKPRWHLGRYTPANLLPLDVTGRGWRPQECVCVCVCVCVIGGQGGVLMCHSQTGSGLSSGSQSNSSSFTSISEPSGHRHVGTIGMMMGRRSETEGASASPPGERRGAEGGTAAGERRERSARSIAAANAFKFRERSLSTPTDSGSLGSTDNGCDRGESYALLYPSGSSEDGSASADNVSVTDASFPADGRLRLRSRSISLKKSKRKPPPPVRSVSLMKNLGDAEGRMCGYDVRHYRDGRPKSLHIPREHLQDFQPDFLLPSSVSKPDLEEPELGHSMLDGPPSLEVQEPDSTELSFPAHWQLGDWKASDPYRSLSGSSTATGTTVIECMKVQGSSESLLDSPSTSRATSPSLLSVEAESTKALSPFKPPGVMSPSSGYSSQSETLTPITPSNQGVGTLTGPASTMGCKMRPKIPERKSSLPASPRDPAARSRLSFEMPVNAHLDLSSIKPKQKAGRRHSDTSTAAKPGKLSPSSQSALPVVTTNELRNIRLRSVSRTDLEDCPDGASDDIIEEEQGRPLVAPKPKPPVAMKPPLPKRPLNLLLKSPSSSPVASDSPPASPVDYPRPMPNPSIYMVIGRKPKLKKALPHTPTSPCGALDQPPTFPLHHPQALYEHPSFSHIQSLYDLPPLPLPQPLLEDPTMEPEFNPVPPPVPKKPNVLLLPSNSTAVHSNGTTDRMGTTTDSPATLHSPVSAFPTQELPGKEDHQENHLGTATRFFISFGCVWFNALPTSLSRSKRKVLGRKEPGDSFGSRQSLISPVKHSTSGGDLRTMTLGSTPRSSSRNDNFMALLQKKGNKSSTGGARVSAMELLKSTNPLARRVTEFYTSTEGGGDATAWNEGNN
uniref:NHS-like 2 n=1 Tax=Esox lucius TaxID=8010 RepID=A0AAY5LAM5_ESOLU